MSKFKIGDRVRATKDYRDEIVAHWNEHWRASHGELSDFYVADFLGSVFSDSIRLSNKPDGSGPYWPSSYFTPDTTVRKGDKFRVNVDDRCDDYSNGDVFTAVEVRDYAVVFYDNAGDRRLIYIGDVTLVDDHGEPWDHDPRPLKIEEGKYYRTRDGRKVGPMRTVGGEWSDMLGLRAKFTIDGYGDVDAEGFWLTGERKSKHDLIAEWHDPKPKGCAAAEVDNLRDEYGPVVAAPVEPAKFKVGDRVRFVEGYASSAAGTEATVVAVPPISWGIQVDGVNGISTESPSSLEPATPTIQPGQFVTLQGYVRSINGKTAHVDIIGPDVPYNRSYPLSALRAA